tara:strand:- start:1269 stop:1646 length:378 start_codon:yes stop_codon:yes gene_type:complete
MPVTIEEWKEHTHSLATNTEIETRCFAARYYYVAYHSVTTLVDGLMDGGKGGIHEQLIHTLVNGFTSGPNSKEYKKVGYKLSAAKALRAKADYKLGTDFSESDLELLRNHVDTIITSVEKLGKAA